MQRIRNRGNKGDGPPMMSQEFVIQNHADIVSCVCMVVFMLLIPQASPVSVLRVDSDVTPLLYVVPCRPPTT